MKVGIDGGCAPNPGPGAWAVVFDDGVKYSGAEEDTTNNRMELYAAIVALARDDLDEIEIVTDSRYVEGLLAKGWKPKMNGDLVAEMRKIAATKKRVTVRWVRGHVGEPLNEAADALCTETMSAHVEDTDAELVVALDRWD
jgi:ribonuclease HI